MGVGQACAGKGGDGGYPRVLVGGAGGLRVRSLSPKNGLKMFPVKKFHFAWLQKLLEGGWGKGVWGGRGPHPHATAKIKAKPWGYLPTCRNLYPSPTAP